MTDYLTIPMPIVTTLILVALMGIQLAIDLLEKAYRIGKDMKHFKIFLRSYSKENEGKINDIINFYNEKAGNKLVLFGTNNELYTYTNLIDEEALEHAKEFYAGYASKDKDARTWEQRHLITDKKTDEDNHIYYVKTDRQKVTLNDINGVIRKENQDIANYRHIDTKLKLVGLSRNSTKEEFDKLNGTQKKNLAICEHLRWNASHEMLGYVYSEEDTSDLKKTHNCIKPWQTLTKEYQGYDYKVMERTIDIITNNNEKR